MTIPGVAGLSTTAAAAECLERAQALAEATSHKVLTVEHLVLALLEAQDPTILDAVGRRDLDPAALQERLQRAGNRVSRGRGGRGRRDAGSIAPAARKAIGDASRAAANRGERMSCGDLASAILALKSNPVGRGPETGGQSREPRARREAESKSTTRSQRSEMVRERGRGKANPQEGGPTPSPAVGLWRYPLLLAIPASLALTVLDGPESLLFVTAALAIVPLAGFMGEATEQIASRSGPALGGFLNATFGNAAELIIAIVALRAGLIDLVKASITGSILGNLLLIMGLSFFVGGVGRPVLRFNRTTAGMSAGMLALAVAGLVFPALFQATHPASQPDEVLHLSEAVAGILAVTYVLSLVFSFRTHRSLFGHGGEAGGHSSPPWAMGKALGILALATGGVALESEFLVHTVEAVTRSFGLSEVFLGLIVIPIIGNAAEHSTAVLVARKGKMDLAIQIALGSSTQVALLVAPLLILVGVVLGQNLNLVFSSFEVMAIGLATVIASIITLDGETHWFEGVQLLALFALVAVAAYFV